MKSTRRIATEPPALLKIESIRDKFEADGTIHVVQKLRSERPCTASSPIASAVVLK
jgi:hypothetical protein